MDVLKSSSRRNIAIAAASRCVSALAALSSAFAQTPSGPPIRIGSTLALTGPLSATAQVHKLVGEIYVEQLNKRGGLLGRPVEWIVKDDQSQARTSRARSTSSSSPSTRSTC